jgi:O-antigen/teichoic acid export membrane protein
LITSGNTRSAKASRQVIYSLILKGISIIVSFINVPLMLNYFNQEKYGIWLTLVSIIGWIGFFDIGLGNGLRNKLAESLTTENFKLGRKYVSTTYAILICIFSVVLILFHATNIFLDWGAILNTKTVSAHELYILTSLVFTFMCMNFIAQLIGTIYLADQKPSVNDAVNTLAGVITLLFVYTLIKISNTGNLVLFGSVASALPLTLFIMLSIYSFKTRFSHLKPSVASVNFSLSRNLLNLGLRFFLMQVTFIVIFTTSNFIITRFFGPSEVVSYNVVYRYFQLPIMVLSIILSPLWGAVTDAYTCGDYEWLKKTMGRMNVISVIFAIGIIIMVIISMPVFHLWVGDKVKIPMALVVLMALYALMNAVTAPYSMFINGTGKIRLTSSLSIIAIAQYLLSVFLFTHLIKNSTAVILAIIFTNLPGLIYQPIQTYKILNRKAIGIWNK